MKTPKAYAFTQRSYNGDFKKGDIAHLDCMPRDSYHKCWVLVVVAAVLIKQEKERP
jgi:hypothetical protein